MTNEVVVSDDSVMAGSPPVVPAVASQSPVIVEPIHLLSEAVQRGAEVDQLERLMELVDRFNKDNARKAFHAALADFQAHCPQIRKMKQGHNYKYAPLADIVAQVQEQLSHSGLSYRFEQDHSNNISVTCIVSHVDGHSERMTMTAMPDTSGSKNSVQAIGSTVQYLMRYTFVGSLGITTADEDIDGRLPPAPANHANPPYPDDRYAVSFAQWKQGIETGAFTPESIIDKVQKDFVMSGEQIDRLMCVQTRDQDAASSVQEKLKKRGKNNDSESA